MVMIDDATNRTYARFYPAEDTRAAFDVFGRYYDRYGLPQGLYPDQDSIYQVNAAQESRPGQPVLTQFGRAMQQLAVGLRPAHSPQAKGRVERRHQVFQDRLVKELRLAKINDSQWPRPNRRICIASWRAGCAWRRCCAGKNREWWRGTGRSVGRGTIGRLTPLSVAGKVVVVRTLLDGRHQLLYQQQKLTWRELPARPQPVAGVRCVPPVKEPLETKAAAAHPWRRFGMAAGKKFLANRRRAGGGPLPPGPPPARRNIDRKRCSPVNKKRKSQK
jgi:hypothetical protein